MTDSLDHTDQLHDHDRGLSRFKSLGREMIPEETGGPYPADGSNGVNVLTESGVVPIDSSTSFGTASGVATVVPLTINLLRGVQETDGDGNVTFTSIYPAAYSGLWPHIHFEVYPSLTDATAVSSKLRTSQLALPEDTSTLVYATDGCSQSAQHGAVLAGERQRIQRRVFPAARHGDRRRRHRLVAALNVPV